MLIYSKEKSLNDAGVGKYIHLGHEISVRKYKLWYIPKTSFVSRIDVSGKLIKSPDMS